MSFTASAVIANSNLNDPDIDVDITEELQILLFGATGNKGIDADRCFFVSWLDDVIEGVGLSRFFVSVADGFTSNVLRMLL